MKTELGRGTSFACFAFLEDFVGHDESVVFVTGDEDVGIQDWLVVDE